MANPNLAALASWTKERVAGSIASSAIGTLLANPAASGEVLEVVTAMFANIDGAAAVDLTVDLVQSDGLVSELVRNITISVKSSEAVITSLNKIVLQEGDILRRKASVGGDLSFVLNFNRFS